MPLGSNLGPAELVYSAEALTLFAAMTIQPSPARKLAIDSCIIALDGAGVWDKLDGFYGLAAASSQVALLNWKTPGTFNATVVNTPVFKPDHGYTGSNITTSYLDTGFNPATAGGNFILDSHSMGIYSLSAKDNLNAAMGNATNRVDPLIAGDLVQTNSAAAADTAANTDASGHFALTRTGSTGYSRYVRSKTAVAVSRTSSALTSATFWIGGRNGGAVANAELAMAFFGGGLSDAEHGALFDAWAAYLRAVGVIA